MRHFRTIRAKEAAIAAMFTLAAAAGCGRNALPTQATPLSGATVAPPTVGEEVEAADPALRPQLAAVRAATAQFHDVAAAIAAGYRDPAGGICDTSPAGTMGIHTQNPALVASQVLDPERPEVLLYLPKTDGSLRLVAVEYIQPVLVRNPATGVVSPWFAPTPWPADYQVVTPTPELFGQNFQGPMAGHVPGMPWHWDLHVWVWSHNPSGLFAQWNPALSCPAE